MSQGEKLRSQEAQKERHHQVRGHISLSTLKKKACQKKRKEYGYMLATTRLKIVNQYIYIVFWYQKEYFKKMCSECLVC